MSRVTLVGLSKKDSLQFQTYFQTVGVACDFLPNLESLMDKLPADPPTLIVAEKPDQLEALQSLRAVLKVNAPATPFIVTLSNENVLQAMEALTAGAYECLARPYSRLDVLAAAKRATTASGRTLFGAKVKAEKKPWAAIAAGVFLLVMSVGGIKVRLEGPPEPLLNLGSATLSGIQWEGRSLWVGNWVDATVTHYISRKGLFKKQRSLTSDEIFRMQDSQPILVCNTPDAIVTVGFDLKLRTHQRAVGLPTLQTAQAPGSNPTGLAWDGDSLWSSDGQTGLLYKHGPDLRVMNTVKSLLPDPAGLAWDGNSLWVVGGTPLRLAKRTRQGSGWTWTGPYPLKNFLPEGVPPAGMTVGFGRIWMVTGGAPHMTSRAIKDITQTTEGWRQ